MKNIFFLLSFVSAVFANPKAPEVMHGDVSFSDQGSVLEIKASEQAVIHWQNFSVSEGEVTRFIQPGIESAILNRVVGDNVSQIMGAIEANGKVYISNPNGIMIGPNGRIDAAAFMATTAEISMEQYLTNHPILLHSTTGYFLNQGVIETSRGPITILAPEIANEGDLLAVGGNLNLVAGDPIFFDPTGDQIIFIQTEWKEDLDPLPSLSISGSLEATEVEFSGGSIYLTAPSGKIHIEKSATIQSENSSNICFDSASHTVIEGAITAASGNIKILGDTVELLSARVDCSSNRDAGSIYIGGGYRGKDPTMKNSHKVVIDKDSHLYANSLDQGNGGRVILWGDETAIFLGDIEAKGGPLGGDGGFIECSSPNFVLPEGRVNTLAPNGKTGTFLIDPTNVTMNEFVADTDFTFSAPNFNFTGNSVNIRPSTIVSNLASSNVVIDTSAATDQAQAGTIELNTPLALTQNTLTLTADSDLSLSDNVTLSGSASLVMSGNRIFSSVDIDISDSADLSMTSAGLLFLGSSGSITCSSSTSDITITSTGGQITIDQPVTITSDTNFTVSTSDRIFINSTANPQLTLSSTGDSDFSFTASSLFINIGNVTFDTEGALTLSPGSSLVLGGTINFTTPQDLTISAGTTTSSSVNTVIGSSSPNLGFTGGIQTSGADITINADGNLTIAGGNSQADAFTATAGGTLTLGGNISAVTNNSALSLTSSGNMIIQDSTGIAVNSGSSITMSSGGNITIGNAFDFLGRGASLMIANGSITCTGTSGTMQVTTANDLNIVCDNANPNPPSFGSATLSFPSGFIFRANDGGNKVMLYMVRPGVNSLPTFINNTTYSPGSTLSNGSYSTGTNEFVGYWYLTKPPPDPPAFEVIFKTASLGLQDQTLEIALVEPLSNDESSQDPDLETAVPDPKNLCKTPPSAVQSTQ